MNNKFYDLKKRTILPSQFVILFCEYLWAFLIILDGNSVYRHMLDMNIHLPLLCAIASLILVFALKIKIKRKDCTLILVMELWCGLYLICNFKDISIENFFCMFLVSLPAIYLCFKHYVSCNKEYRLLFCLENIIFLIALVSLILWFLGPVFSAISTNMQVKINWGSEKTVQGYWGLIYNIQHDTTFGISSYRNSSIFTEAPMFNLWLDIALCVELFLKDKWSKIRVFVMIIAILSTISTTGILFILLCLVLKYKNVFDKSKSLVRIVMIFGVIITIPYMIGKVINLIELKSKTISFAIRIKDYAIGYLVWKKNPVFGCGFANLTPLYQYSIIAKGNTGYSNSIMAILATGGLWISFIFILSFIGFFISQKDERKKMVSFGICYIFLFITTIFFARTMSIVFIALGITALSNKFIIRN